MNWIEFDGKKFEEFCSILLQFVISKKYVPFSGPGRDDGIDGWYEGEFGGKSGKWRFQMKYRSPETGRTRAVASLFSAIKHDINSNIKNENHIVFLTNIEITPKKRDQIFTHVNSELKEKKLDISFELWDGAKLEALLVAHPLVQHWFDKGLTYQMQPYQKYFKKELDNTNQIYTLTNKFYHRTTALKQLKNSFKEMNSVTIVSGEAGIGKTRLCVEFFKTINKVEENWHALVLAVRNVDLLLLKQVLTGTKNYILLIDDADRINSTLLNDIIRIVEAISTNRILLVLTVRNYKERELVESFPLTVQSKTKNIRLVRFNREETLKIFEGELIGIKFLNIGHLVALTFGLPLIISSVINLIKSGKTLSDLSSEESLDKFITSYFNQISNTIAEDENVGKNLAKDVLSVISFIEPIRMDDPKLHQHISEVLNKDVEQVNRVLYHLKKNQIIRGTHSVRIKPDLYSETLLMTSYNQDLAKTITKKFPQYIGNVIVNVGGVDQNESLGLTHRLLGFYLQEMSAIKNLFDLEKHLETVYSVSFIKQEFCIEALEQVLELFNEETGPLFFEKWEMDIKRYPLQGVLDLIKKTLRALSEQNSYTFIVCQLTSRFYELIRDENLASNIARFGSRDHFNNYNCKTQVEIVKYIERQFNQEAGNHELPLLYVENLLRLEFTETRQSATNAMSIQISHYYPPDNVHVRDLRLRLIDSLIELYHKTKHFNERIIDIISNIPVSIIASRTKSYLGHEDLQLVYDFLIDISSKKMDLSTKIKLRDRVSWYNRFEIEDLKSKSDQIKKNLESTDLPELISDLINPDIESESYDEKAIEEKMLKLIEPFSGSDIAHALVKAHDSNPHTPVYFYNFIKTLTDKPAKSQELLFVLLDDNQDFLFHHFSGFLLTLRFKHMRSDFFWDFIARCKVIDTSNATSFLLGIYRSNFFIPEVESRKNYLQNERTKDSTLLEHLYTKDLSELHHILAWSLPTMYFLNEKKGESQILKFVKQCGSQSYDTLLLAMEVSKTPKFPFIKKMVLNETVHLPITYSVTRLLKLIIERDGIEKVISYVSDRVKYKSTNLKASWITGYHVVPHKSNVDLLKNLNILEKTVAQRVVLDSYIHTDYGQIGHYFASDILEFFIADKRLTPELFNIYTDSYEESKNNIKILTNLIHSLRIFEEKDEVFINLIVHILRGIYNGDYNSKEVRDLEVECSAALTDTGVRWGAVGEPFSSDLVLRDLIINVLDQEDIDPRLVPFFKRILTDLKHEIESSKRRGGDEEW